MSYKYVCSICGAGFHLGSLFHTHKQTHSELKQRIGDQPLPIINNYPNMQDLLKQDIETRKVVGLAMYGTLLQPFNGRDFLRDAYEESLDQSLYLRGALFERDGK